MMRKCLSLIFTTTFISSCATQYVQPTDGELAVLLMPTKESSYRFFGGASAASVTFAIKGDDGCGSVYKQILPKKQGAKDVEVSIPANKEIFVSFAANSGNTACHVAGSFKAFPNKKYRVVNMGGGYQCMVGVVEVTSEGKRIQQSLERAYPDTWSGTKICDKR